MHKTNLKTIDLDPHQRLHFPARVILLDHDDAHAFHDSLAEVRHFLPDDEKHFLKMKTVEELTADNTYMFGVKTPNGRIASGGLLTAPIDSRTLAGKFKGYPFEAAKEQFGVMGSLFTLNEYAGMGLSKMVVGTILDHAQSVKSEMGLRHILAGVAGPMGAIQGNVKSLDSLGKRGFKEVHLGYDPVNEHPMSYLRYNL